MQLFADGKKLDIVHHYTEWMVDNMKIIKTLTKLTTVAGVSALAAGAGSFHFGLVRNGGGKYLRKYTMKKAYGSDTDTFISERAGNQYIKARKSQR